MAEKTAKKTKVEALTARRVDEEAALTTLQAQAANKDAAIKALEELTAADLAEVDLADLERESRKQAQARVEADALRIEVAELRRRIAKQQAAIAQTGRDLLAEERAAIAAEGATLEAELSAEIAELAAKLAKFLDLDRRHMSLDARSNPIPGYPGSHIPDARLYLELAPLVHDCVEREAFLARKAARAAAARAAAAQ